MTSIFADFDESAYPHRFSGSLLVGTILGGTPTDPKVAEGWLRTKLEDKDDIIRDLVAEVMVERGVDVDEATAEVDRSRHLNGFRRDEHGLYIEGRQLKAAIKEAANVRWAGERWGPTRKGTAAFFAEHVFVTDQRLYLGVSEPTGIMQRFVHTWRGSAIQYEEYVEDAKIDFTIATDFAFTDKQWALLWLTGERQGLGASRSQGYGCYSVVRWDREDSAHRPAAAPLVVEVVDEAPDADGVIAERPAKGKKKTLRLECMEPGCDFVCGQSAVDMNSHTRTAHDRRATAAERFPVEVPA